MSFQSVFLYLSVSLNDHRRRDHHSPTFAINHAEIRPTSSLSTSTSTTSTSQLPIEGIAPSRLTPAPTTTTPTPPIPQQQAKGTAAGGDKWTEYTTTSSSRLHTTSRPKRKLTASEQCDTAVAATTHPRLLVAFFLALFIFSTHHLASAPVPNQWILSLHERILFKSINQLYYRHRHHRHHSDSFLFIQKTLKSIVSEAYTVATMRATLILRTNKYHVLSQCTAITHHQPVIVLVTINACILFSYWVSNIWATGGCVVPSHKYASTSTTNASQFIWKILSSLAPSLSHGVAVALSVQRMVSSVIDSVLTMILTLACAGITFQYVNR